MPSMIAPADSVDCGPVAGATAAPVSRMEAFVRWLLRPPVLLRGSMLLIAAVYIRTINFYFVYDDVAILVSPWNEWRWVGEIFRHDLFGFRGDTGSVYYRPLSALWIVVVKQLTGGAPGWFHLSAIAIHLAVFYLAYVLGRLLLREERFALLTALIYALHPTKVESVAWIGSSGCDGLGAICFFGSLICYLKSREKHAVAWLSGSVVLFAAAMLIKETLVIAPVLIAVHYWLNPPRGQSRLWVVLQMAPFAAVVAGYMLLRHAVLRPLPATSLVARPSLTMTNLWSAPLTLWWYVRQLLLPARLSVMYDPITVAAPTLWNFVLPLVGLGVVIAVAYWIWTRHRSPNYTFLALWFAITLAPFVVMSPMVLQHDRYLYLPSYAFSVLVAWLLLTAGGSGQRATRIRVASAVMIIALWSASVWHESGFWDNELSLWGRAVQVAPLRSTARVQLAWRYIDKNDAASALKVLDDGLARQPKSPALWRTRGVIEYDRQQYESARKAFLKTIEVAAFYDDKPSPDIWEAKAASAYYLAQLDTADKNYVSAEKWLRIAVALQPNSTAYRNSLAAMQKIQAGASDSGRRGAVPTIPAGPSQ